MDRSLVQAKPKRSDADASARIAQATVNTAVHARCTGLVLRMPGRSRLWRAREPVQFRTGSVGRSPCAIDALALTWCGHADPIAALTLPVCPRESDATADRARNRLHGLP
jgi:hypothetical protein